MRLLLLLNNWGAWQVAEWLKQRNENIVGLVLQPPDDRRFADEILSTLDMPPDKVWLSNQLRDPDTLAELRELRPDIGISAFFGLHPQAGDDPNISEWMYQPSLGPSPLERRMAH